jgi:LPS-assembly protein
VVAGRHGQIRKVLTVLSISVALSTMSGACWVDYGSPAFAQEAGTSSADLPADAKLLLSATTLIYNRDANKITAQGAVQLNYAGYKMVAKRLDYDQASGRLVATGSIELIEPDGNRIYADTMDVTDTFSNGFVNALRVETTDNTRLAAESAERIDATQMVLHNGVYSACLPCADRPDGAPLWQVKAQRVVQNGVTHTVRMENARFELFGMPIAYLPYLEVPDQTVKRKSGFLFPTFKSAQSIGFGMNVPYYLVISPSMDATLNTTGYSQQGVLLDGEFRQRFETGQHEMHLAWINQSTPSSFTTGTSDGRATGRFLASSKAEFKINPRWAFGWDVMAQSDNNFAKTYQLSPGSEEYRANQVYLKGLGERNNFDLRSYYFDVQDADADSKAEEQQAIVRPVLDYQYFAPKPVVGGQLSANVNLTSLTRSRYDVFSVNGVDRYRGLPGDTTRLTAEAEWKRTFITGSGLSLTPLLAARADSFQLGMKTPNSLGGGYSYAGNYTADGTATRTMVTAGLEARYPLLFTGANSNHIFEPIAQIFLRPDEQLAGQLPNEDAQSMVFDATNLFDRDKFSGYDRIEGGGRANVGFKYTGNFDGGYVARVTAGQSYQLFGKNSYASNDLVKAGANSGLESSASDLVAMASISNPGGFSLSASTRFDHSSLKLNRADTAISYTGGRFETSLIYSHVAPQPDYGLINEGREIQTSASVKLDDHWKVNGKLTFDINANFMTENAIGLSYGDECTTFAFTYKTTYDPLNKNASDWSIGGVLTFRTLGDIRIAN